jgi:hypothetical protein
LRLQKIVKEHAEEYGATAGKLEKMKVAGHLLRRLKSSGSRFLIFDKSAETWTEVPDKVARNKVSKTIRNSRRTVGAISLSHDLEP